MDGLERALFYQNELYHALDKDYRDKLKTKRYNAKYYKEHINAWKTKYYHYQKKGRSSGKNMDMSVGSSKSAGDTTYSKPIIKTTITTRTSTTDKHIDPLKKIMGSDYAKVALNILDVAGDMAMNTIKTMINPFNAANIVNEDVQKVVETGLMIKQHIEAEQRAAEIEERKKHERYDEKTGFHLKTYNLSPEEDLKEVNAKFKNLDSGSKNNCMLCSVTTELRKRGYDATANQADYGYYEEDIKRWFPEATTELVDIADWKNYLLATQEEGASGVLCMHRTFGGHAVHYQIKGGKVIISDGQNGEIYNNLDIGTKVVSLTVTRLDNQEPDWKSVKEACT